MDVREIGAALWRQRLLVLSMLVLGATTLAGVLWLAPKTYESVAGLQAVKDPTAQASAAQVDAARRDLAGQASSPAVLTAVRDRLRVETPARALAEQVQGDWAPGRERIEVTVRDQDRRLAARLANAVAARLAATSSSSDGGLVTVTVSERATVPGMFVDPPLTSVLAGGLGATLLLALGVALLRDWRTETVDDADDVESAAVAPLLAHLTAPADLTLMPALHQGSAEADVFRHLRLALEAETSGGPSKKVVVAGLGTGEIGVWLGANVAIALAHVGRRVLLVDGRMGDRFGIPAEPGPDTPGLHGVLLGADLHRAVSPGPVELLSVLPAGSWGDADDPDSLRDQSFDRVMAEAADLFDVVVVLAPPLDVADDAQQMAVGGSLLLAVTEGRVSSSTLRSHASRVRSAGGRILGVVLIGRRTEPTAA